MAKQEQDAGKYIMVNVILTKDNQILLQLRKNTCYPDGVYDVSASGKLEPGEAGKPGETAIDAAIRKIIEDVGVVVRREDLKLIHARHDLDEQRINLFFWARRYEGMPRNCKPSEYDGLLWTTFDELPKNIIPYLPEVFGAWQRNQYYSDSSS